MARITGLGGIFYKVADPKATQAWYQDNLGIGGDWGATFRYSDEGTDDPFSLLDELFVVNLQLSLFQAR